MVFILWLAACDRPNLISAEVSFVTPDPGDHVCNDSLDVRYDVSSMIDRGADSVLLAVFDDLSEDEPWDPAGTLLVVGDFSLPEGDTDTTFNATLDWGDIAEQNSGRVLLVADVGDFSDLNDGDRMEAEDYEDAVSVADVWARATVSVRVCPE